METLLEIKFTGGIFAYLGLGSFFLRFIKVTDCVLFQNSQWDTEKNIIYIIDILSVYIIPLIAVPLLSFCVPDVGNTRTTLPM